MIIARPSPYGDIKLSFFLAGLLDSRDTVHGLGLKIHGSKVFLP